MEPEHISLLLFCGVLFIACSLNTEKMQLICRERTQRHIKELQISAGALLCEHCWKIKKGCHLG